ncbi:MAG: hypothetical protein IJ757_06535 [Clostridiales bacterium]|nr:hypothetical protein [Clostridiales bacterium]
MKSTFILPAVLIVSVLITNFIYLAINMEPLGFTRERVDELQEMGTDVEGYQDSFMAGFQSGINSANMMIEEEEEEIPEDYQIFGEGLYYYEDVATIFSLDVGGLHELLMMAIFIGLYIGSVYKTGMDKNLSIFAGRRGLLFGVRMLMIALYSLVIHLINLLTAILSMAMMGESVRLGFDKAFYLYFLVTWILTIAFGCVVMSVTHITRSKAAGMTLGILLSVGILSTIVSVVSLILQKRYDLAMGFNLGNYTLTHNLSAMNLYSDGHFTVRALICAAVYFCLAYIGSLIVVRRRDIA